MAALVQIVEMLNESGQLGRVFMLTEHPKYPTSQEFEERFSDAEDRQRLLKLWGMFNNSVVDVRMYPEALDSSRRSTLGSVSFIENNNHQNWHIYSVAWDDSEVFMCILRHITCVRVELTETRGFVSETATMQVRGEHQRYADAIIDWSFRVFPQQRKKPIISIRNLLS